MIPSSSEEMEPFEFNNYTFKRIIGRGSFSIVFEAESMQYSSPFAAKVTPLDECQLTEEGDFFDPELSALIELDNPGIIRVYNYFIMNKFLVLILEYCESGTLLDLIQKKKLKGQGLADILAMIAKALQYCHAHSVSHRDIKPSNIFIDYYGRPKLADFGLSMFMMNSRMVHGVCGSNIFAAPEVYGSEPYDAFAADIYALGKTFYQVAMGDIDTCESIDFADKSISINPRLLELIETMVSRNPKDRPTINEVLACEYFQSYSLMNQSEKKLVSLPRSISISSQLPVFLKDERQKPSSNTLTCFNTRSKLKKVPSSLFPKRCKSLTCYDFPTVSSLPQLHPKK